MILWHGETQPLTPHNREFHKVPFYQLDADMENFCSWHLCRLLKAFGDLMDSMSTLILGYIR